jgi:pimeloyl-ACP methyl ester carboxylesterase
VAHQALGAVPHPHRPAGLIVRTDVEFDVSAVVDGARVAGSLFVPPAAPRPDGRTVVLVCLPGGTYTRAYWDLTVTGRAGYSFAEDMAARGHVVAALDNLGTGASHRPPNGADVTVELWGRVAAEVARQLRERLRPDHGDDLAVVGVGHSMGGYAVIAQQAHGSDFDAVAILGTSNQPMAGVYSTEAGAPPPEEQHRALVDQMVGSAHDGYLQPDRVSLRALFHLADVPPDVLAADDAPATQVPVGAAAGAVEPGAYREAAGKITAPVLLAFGEVDVSPSPYTEVAAYSASGDVRLLVLAGSAHCHNAATTRQVLWDQLAGWIADIAASGEYGRSTDRPPDRQTDPVRGGRT